MLEKTLLQKYNAITSALFIVTYIANNQEAIND
jgi:hypothetical protein